MRNVRAAGWTFTLTAGLCSGQLLRAADFVLSSSQSANAITASLEYQETAYSVINWGASLTTQMVPFTNEPSSSGKVVRGVLNFGDGSTNAMAFVWQRDAGKLFLDLNRNQDLTDDAAGVFSARPPKQLNYQSFTNVHLPISLGAGPAQVLADINFWDYSSRPSCSLAIRSFWQGKVTLHGHDWQVGIVPKIWAEAGSRNISLENGQLLLRPWEQRDKAFSAFGGSLDAIQFARKLFVGGKAYQLDCLVGSPTGKVQPALRFIEQSVVLGELKITGQYIWRMVLQGDLYRVVLDRPSGTVAIPQGNYGEARIQLEQNGTEAFCNSSQTSGARRISVDDTASAVLNVGGPLTNSVTASRHGQDLRLDYRLVGVGGEIYQLANEDRSHPPEFAVFKGDRKIASGKFEFG